jgi:hypothetical protein
LVDLANRCVAGDRPEKALIELPFRLTSAYECQEFSQRRTRPVRVQATLKAVDISRAAGIRKGCGDCPERPAELL